MPAPALDPPKRIRASEAALRIALDVVREKGMSVEKLLIQGGQFEIHFGGVDAANPAENDGGLKQI